MDSVEPCLFPHVCAASWPAPICSAAFEEAMCSRRARSTMLEVIAAVTPA